MAPFIEIIEKGGIVMIALMILAFLLYERCVHMLLFLRKVKNGLSGEEFNEVNLDGLRYFNQQLSDSHYHYLIQIRTMIAAAPLLGLLGTVIGMVETFMTLALQSGDQTIQGLSNGISKALITTEMGLAIAIPAVVLLYFGQRLLNHSSRLLMEKEGLFSEQELSR